MGLLHIYCGDGKGKTTAALGLTMRAAGCKMRVHFVQLLKGNMTSELSVLKSMPGVTVERCDKNYGFTFNMAEEKKVELIECHNRLLKNALQIMKNGEADLIVIDEFNVAYSLNLLDKKLAEELIFHRNPHVELVITGRNADQKFIEAADYVSEIRCVKHPFDKGIHARRGIEY